MARCPSRRLDGCMVEPLRCYLWSSVILASRAQRVVALEPGLFTTITLMRYRAGIWSRPPPASGLAQPTDFAPCDPPPRDGHARQRHFGVRRGRAGAAPRRGHGRTGHRLRWAGASHSFRGCTPAASVARRDPVRRAAPLARVHAARHIRIRDSPGADDDGCRAHASADDAPLRRP